ncbi:unnamed protein product, partial [Owenia fusiformis]
IYLLSRNMPASSSGYQPARSHAYTKWDTEKDEVTVDYKKVGEDGDGTWFSGRKGAIIKGLIVIVVFFVGLVIGYVIRRGVHENSSKPNTPCLYGTPMIKDFSDDASFDLVSGIEAKSIEQDLKEFTTAVHIAGTEKSNELGDLISSIWKENKLMEVSKKSYDVLLSYPDYFDKPNKVEILDGAEGVVYECNTKAPRDSFHPELRPFNAYSPNGTAQGELVYANYGRLEDFAHIASKGVNISGAIVVMRYGKIYRGNKVQHATDQGAIGVILYSDPEDKAMDPSKLYPNGWLMPDYAVERGSILPSITGDPLTPDIPAVSGAYRLPISKANLPTIPVQPISYKDAYALLSKMSGPAGREDFQGGFNFSYNIGPGYTQQYTNWTVKLEVNNKLEMRKVTNIIGVIKGIVEPDRYVIVGCHHDAWTYGGVDPNTGTALMSQLIKSLGEIEDEDWRPRRTLIFASWDAEEFGLIGSYEWVEDNMKQLASKAVAYINLDGAIRGNYTFTASASPLMRHVLYDATRDVLCADQDHPDMSVYEMWKMHDPVNSSDLHTLPKVSLIGSGSDQSAFVNTLGVPSLWPVYRHNFKAYPFQTPPAYHTSLDTYRYVKNFIDPHFMIHETMGKVVAEIVLRLVDSAKLPVDVRDYRDTVWKAYNDTKDQYASHLNNKNIKLDGLYSAVREFGVAADMFAIKYQKLSITKTLELRRRNDQVMLLSRAFILPSGLPGRPQLKNLLLSPSSYNTYGSSLFPGLSDTIYEATTSGDWEPVKQQLSALIIALHSARNILSEETLP